MADYALSGKKWGTAGMGTSGGQITWSFATSNYADQSFSYDAQISDAQAKAAVEQAFNRWESVCFVDFVQVADGANVDIRLGWDAIDGPNNIVGQCFSTWSTPSNIYTDAELRFDTAEQWNYGTGGNFYAVVLHEIGHAIGLGHYEGADVIMNAFTGGATDLAPGDIAGAQALYGAKNVTPPEEEPPGERLNDKFDSHASTVAVMLSGGEGDDLVWGGTAADELYGNAGRDIMIGDKGADTLYGDDGVNSAGAGDQLLGGYGRDTAYGAAGDDYINGEWNDDRLHGGAGDDLIYGGYGQDKLWGNEGDDILWGASSKKPNGAWFGDAILLNRDASTGAAISETWTIAGQKQSSDGSRDFLWGGAGNDHLMGGGGADSLNGGAGSDRFVFRSIADSKPWSGGRDTITDFTHADWISLATIDANTKRDGNQSFTFIGAAKFHGKAGELRFVKKASDTYVYADVNGNKKADFSIHLDDAVKLVKSDFFL